MNLKPFEKRVLTTAERDRLRREQRTQRWERLEEDLRKERSVWRASGAEATIKGVLDELSARPGDSALDWKWLLHDTLMSALEEVYDNGCYRGTEEEETRQTQRQDDRERDEEEQRNRLREKIARMTGS